MTRAQLLELGFSAEAIQHRVRKGRLHPAFPRVFAVGRPELTERGTWMAAVLACGPGAAGSHGTAAAIHEIGRERGRIEVSVEARRNPRITGIRIHRRSALRPQDIGVVDGIPVTSAIRTLIDLAGYLSAPAVEAAINEADKLDLVDPETLRAALDSYRGERGVANLRSLLDQRTFTLTASELERRFARLVRAAGLPPPLTGQQLNGFTVDCFWPELGLVVETDGLRYHRTPSQQAHDRLRDQTHTAAGLTALRFTYAQVRYEPEYVQRTLAAVARRLTSD